MMSRWEVLGESGGGWGGEFRRLFCSWRFSFVLRFSFVGGYLGKWKYFGFELA